MRYGIAKPQIVSSTPATCQVNRIIDTTKNGGDKKYRIQVESKRPGNLHNFVYGEEPHGSSRFLSAVRFNWLRSLLRWTPFGAVGHGKSANINSDVCTQSRPARLPYWSYPNSHPDPLPLGRFLDRAGSLSHRRLRKCRGLTRR